jgi:hypothetical protein
VPETDRLDVVTSLGIAPMVASLDLAGEPARAPLGGDPIEGIIEGIDARVASAKAARLRQMLVATALGAAASWSDNGCAQRRIWEC